ncbi:MAG: hypothetical protein H6581_14170 [Bacteroidia bacterium]|nr:hypothetical protein [Bacteroidia bacterium]
MRKTAFLSIFVLLIGYWAYIPTFWFPEFANVAYLRFPWMIHGACILAHVVLIMMYSKWSKWLVLMLHFGLLIATPFLRDSANWLTIKINSDRPVAEFKSPYPGYKLVLPGHPDYQMQGDAMFVYADHGWTFEGLVFQKDHGLNPAWYQQEVMPSSIGKVYNKDWYKYSPD